MELEKEFEDSYNSHGEIALICAGLLLHDGESAASALWLSIFSDINLVDLFSFLLLFNLHS